MTIESLSKICATWQHLRIWLWQSSHPEMFWRHVYRILPHLQEIFLEAIGCGKGTVQAQCFFEPLFFVVVRGEMLRIHQQRPAGSFKDFLSGCSKPAAAVPGKIWTVCH